MTAKEKTKSMKNNQPKLPKYTVVQLVNMSYYIVELDAGGRKEELHKSVIDHHWYATFNGMQQRFNTERKALQYALIGKYSA